MEYGAIDLHTKESEIRIVEADGAVVFERRIATTRDAFDGVFARTDPDANPGGEQWRQRMGRPTSGGSWPRGRGRRSELHADVWSAPRTSQDRSARRRGARRGESARALSSRASRVRCATRCATPAPRTGAARARPAADDQSVARASAQRRGPGPDWGGRDVRRALYAVGGVGGAARSHDAAARVVDSHRAVDRPG